MAVLASLTSRVRRSDGLLTVALLTLSLLQVLWLQPVRVTGAPDSSWFGGVLALVSVLPLLWRRHRPVAAAVVGSCLWWVPTDAFLLLGYVVAVLLFFSVGRWSGSSWRGAAACAWALASGTVGFVALGQSENWFVRFFFDADLQQGMADLTVPGADALLGILGFWLVVLVPFVVGRVIAAQQRAMQQRIESERDKVRDQAVAEERNRIVRELHDVVGHEVTLVAIQAEAAAQALRLAPDRAAGPVEAVRETAHRAGRELRAILDLLGDGDLAVAPDERGLAELTTRAARLGIANRLVVTGRPWADAPRHWLAINRIVQECLTNAGKHAQGQVVEVATDWRDEGVRVCVSNPSAGGTLPGSGHGIPGMTERARLLGGTMTAARVDGYFRVTAWLPAAEASRR